MTHEREFALWPTRVYDYGRRRYRWVWWRRVWTIRVGGAVADRYVDRDAGGADA